MTEIRFYHLTRRSLEDTLPVMLARVVTRDKRRAVVIVGSPERVEALTIHLWTYDDRGFLPHGSREDGHGALQPIWITDVDENPNGAEVAFLSDGATLADPGAYALVCELFDGKSEEAVAAARARWRAYKAAGHALVYFEQNERGGWTRREAG